MKRKVSPDPKKLLLVLSVRGVAMKAPKTFRKETNDVLSDVSSLTDPLRVFTIRTSGSSCSHL